MECQYCKKSYPDKNRLKRHQTTTKSCIRLQHGEIPSKFQTCTMCNKEFTSIQSMKYHITICKKKIEIVEEEMEEEKYNHRQTKEQLEYELKLKSDELNLKLDEIKRLETLLSKNDTKVSKVTNNNSHNTIENQTINHISITNYMTPDRVKDTFSNHFTVEMLLGAQKELANFTVDKFLLGKDKPVYLCTDRSRKKFAFVDDNGKQVEDVNCEKLVRLITPGLNKVHEIYEEALFNTDTEITEEKLHDTYDAIRMVRRDGTVYQQQLSKRLPSKRDEKERMDNETEIDMLPPPEELYRVSNEYEELQPKTIGGISLGKLDVYRQGYRKRKMEAERNGISEKEVEIKVPQALLELYHKNTAIREAYEAFIKS